MSESAPLAHRGRTISVLTAHGQETYQVWVQRGLKGYVARIVTLPNRVWAKPGLNEAIKFTAPTAEEAETVALRFVEDECIATGRRIAPATALTGGLDPPSLQA